ncbi:MAG: hypothetical protein O3C21_12955, partial [Verrucomicrobia bacterium]|nr:hypothetical protein [Verrucomicrobiota bacterium]
DVIGTPALTGIPHTSDSLTIEFLHRVSSAPSDEHLAIDNVRVELSSDDDGMPATWESAHGLNPSKDDSDLDSDLDGRTNLQEFQLSSDPNEGDSPFLHAGKWSVRQIRGIDEVQSLSTQDDRTGALDLLDFGLRVTGEESRTRHSFINFKEQEFQTWLFPESEEPYPLFGAYLQGVDDYVLEATGNIYVRAAGEVTLGFSTDDGAILFNDGKPEITYNQTRQRDSTLATIFLSQGLHQVRFVTFDRDGSAGAALFYATDSSNIDIELNRSNIALLQPFDPLEANTGDRDGDGIDDFTETHLFGNLSASADGDADGDGTSNGAELAQRTSPIKSDTDGDGLTDTAETSTHGTNPLSADTDRDGVSDGFEVSALGSNPRSSDTDADGFGDDAEARAGTRANDNTHYPGSYSGPDVRYSRWAENFDQYADGTTQLAEGSLLLSNMDLQGIQSGALQMTSDSVKSQRTYYKLPQQEFADSGFEIRFRFKLADAVGGNPAADGFSFNYGPIIKNEWAGEEGFGKGLSVEFDTWDSAASGEPAENGYNIAIDGVDVSAGFVNAAIPVDGQFHDARISWIRTGPSSGLATLAVDGSVVFNGVATPGFSPHPSYIMAFAARTAGATEDLFLDEIVVSCPGDQTDTDGDGLLDTWEQRYFGNLAPTATEDPDIDGLSNVTEQTANTSPTLADSDGDRLSDKIEGLMHTDPSNPDTDGDGIGDGSEITGIPASTNPTKFDSDGDGYGDQFEWLQHTDPTDPGSRPSRIPIPYYSAIDQTWRWRIDEVQIAWNHGAAVAIDNDMLFGFVVRNPSENGSNELGWSFRKQWNGVTYLFTAGSNILSNKNGGIWQTDWVFHDDKTRALGFSGTGSVDISQRLSFRCEFKQSPLTGSWGGTYTVVNMDTGRTVASYGFSGYTASQSIQDGTAVWTSRRGLAGGASVWSHAGIDVFIGGAPITAHDTDRDGMSDLFETNHGLNINDPSDASADHDSDGVTNLTEAQMGTRPDLADTDGDGADDHEEILHGYSPADSESSPLALSASLPPILEDTDSNGMNDLWEMRFAARSAAHQADEDADGDGATNREESIAGTDPLRADSRFALRSLVDGDNVRLRWPGLRHKRYEVQSSDRLNNWEPVAQVDPGSDGDTEISVEQALAAKNARIFYRVNAGDRDSDADGLSDWAENELGSDINEANSIGASIRSLSGATLVSGDYRTFVESLQDTGDTSQSAISRPQAARFFESGDVWRDDGGDHRSPDHRLRGLD